MVLTIRGLAVFATILGVNGALAAQHIDSFFPKTEFKSWAAQRPLEQIPWKLKFGSRLTVDQRIVSDLLIEVEGSYFRQRPAGNLVAMIQVSDSKGKVYQDHHVEFLDSNMAGLKRQGVSFSWRAFMIPGDYELKLALDDKSTGRHTFATRNLHLEPLSKDPLPAAWDGLPAMEFLQLKSEVPDSYFHPEAASRLRLPVTPHRPVRLEIVANLTGSGQATVAHSAYELNLGLLLPIVKTFSQMDVRGGTVNVEFLDLVRRRVSFRQHDVRVLDWRRLKSIVTAADPSRVDVHALQDTRHTAAFLREEVASRIATGFGPPDALPVLVLISSSAFFEKLDDITDTLLPTDCQCAVYYIRYEPVAGRFQLAAPNFDNLKKVLKPLSVHTMLAQSPEDLRRIIAKIMDDLSSM